MVWITCALLWCFYQLFGLSFCRHPFTSEEPLVSKWYNAKCLQISSANCRFWVNYYFNIGEGNLLPAPGFLHFQQLSLLLQDVSGHVAVTGNAFHLWMVLKFLYQLLVVVCGSFFSARELWTMRFVSLVKIAYIQYIHHATAEKILLWVQPAFKLH